MATMPPHTELDQIEESFNQQSTSLRMKQIHPNLRSSLRLNRNKQLATDSVLKLIMSEFGWQILAI